MSLILPIISDLRDRIRTRFGIAGRWPTERSTAAIVDAVRCWVRISIYTGPRPLGRSHRVPRAAARTPATPSHPRAARARHHQAEPSRRGRRPPSRSPRRPRDRRSRVASGVTSDHGDAEVVALGVDGRPEPAEGVARYRRRQREADRDGEGGTPETATAARTTRSANRPARSRPRSGPWGRWRSPGPGRRPQVEALDRAERDVVAAGTEGGRDQLCGEPSGDRAGVTADPPTPGPSALPRRLDRRAAASRTGTVFRRPKRGTLLYVLPV
jgi:hypothetical protein